MAIRAIMGSANTRFSAFKRRNSKHAAPQRNQSLSRLIIEACALIASPQPSRKMPLRTPDSDEFPRSVLHQPAFPQVRPEQAGHLLANPAPAPSFVRNIPDSNNFQSFSLREQAVQRFW